MALDSQNVPISFEQGVDTKTDPKQVVVGKMLSLQNASFQNPKEIRKRDGFQALPNTTWAGASVSNGVGLAAFKNELVSYDGQKLYSYSPDLQKQSSQGFCRTSELSVFPVVRNTYSQFNADSALATNGLYCFAYNQTVSGVTSVYYTIVDSSTNTVLVNQSISTGVRPRVVYLAPFFVVYYSNAGNLWQYTIDSTNITATTGPTSIDAFISNAAYDACLYGNEICVSVIVSLLSMKVYTFNIVSGVLTLKTTVTVALPGSLLVIPTNITCKSDGTNVWIAYYVPGPGDTAGTMYALIMQPDVSATPIVNNTAIRTSAYINNIGIWIQGTTGYFLTEEVDANNYPQIWGSFLNTSGTFGSGSLVISSVGLASRPFIIGSNVYFLSVYASAYQSSSIEQTYFLNIINGSAAQVVGKLAPGVAGGFISASFSGPYGNTTPGLLPDPQMITATKFSMPYLYEDRLLSLTSIPHYTTGVQNATFDFSNSLPPSKVYSGQNLLIAGSQLLMYDGASVVEQGFHLFPENATALLNLTGGAIGPGVNQTTDASFQYAIVYEWIDAQGQLHQSAPSVPLTVKIPKDEFTAKTFTGNCALGGNYITATSSLTGFYVGQVLQNVNLSNAGGGTYITAINGTLVTISQPALATASGGTFTTYDTLEVQLKLPTLTETLKNFVSIAVYRTINNVAGVFYRVSSLTSLIGNNPTVSLVNYTDTAADSIIIGNQQLYTDGGEVENINMPATSAITSFKNRAVGIAPESPYSWFYSKQVLPNTPTEFSSELFLENVDQKIGKITAIGTLDDKLILFGPTRKYYVVGSGPTPSGVNNDFSEAQIITGSAGCSNQRSVIELPIGLLYQNSVKGIYLLDRSLQDRYIGADVEAYNGIAITSAVNVPTQNKCVLTLATGVNLVYDYFVNQWEVDPLPASYVVDATQFQSTYCWLAPNGVIYQQTPGQYTDAGAFIPMSFKTGWLSFANIGGFQRVWELQLVGTYKSPHTLTVNIYTDFSTSIAQTVTIPVLSDPGLYQFRIRLTHQKCETMQIEVIESQSAPYGEGFSLSAMNLRAGVKKGQYKLPAGASY